MREKPLPLVEKIFACPELTATLHRFSGPQLAHGVVGTAAIRLVFGLGPDLFFRECIGTRLGERFQNDPLR
jgi:hypothetical protein